MSKRDRGVARECRIENRRRKGIEGEKQEDRKIVEEVRKVAKSRDPRSKSLAYVVQILIGLIRNGGTNQ